MKKLEIALCDTDDAYVTMLASYVLKTLRSRVNIHVFTTPESYFASEQSYDLEILSEDFEEVSHFKACKASQKYYLTEDEMASEDNRIYKYQAVDQILSGIEMLNHISEAQGLGVIAKDKGSELIGIYSPVSHELQMPFALALCQAIKGDERVLFLDLEELSIMSSLFNKRDENNIMDLLFDLKSKDETELSEYVHQYMGIDYINPTYNPNELCEIDEESWYELFRKLKQGGYSKIVVLFGRTVCGFSNLIEELSELIILGKPGDYFDKSRQLFGDYLKRIEANVQVKDVVLPMSANNLTEGTYCLQELLAGNLGSYVNRLIEQSA